MLPSFNILLIQLAGLIVLAILSYQDIKTMTVDTRFNFLMFGLITGFAVQINLVALLAVAIAMVTIYIYFNLIRRFYDFGEADPEVITWAGVLTMLNPAENMQTVIFAVSSAALLIASAIKYRNKRIPFVPIIALSYFVSFVYFITFVINV